jgi:DNA polymerase I
MKFTRLTAESEVLALISWHNEKSKDLVIDVETTDSNPRKAKLLDIQIDGSEPDSAVIFAAEFKHCLNFLNKDVILIAHNYKYDAQVLFRHSIDLLNRPWRDTLLLGHLVDENRDSYSLDSYAKEFWNADYKETFWTRYKSYEEAPEEDKVTYACADIVYTRKLYRLLLQQLSKDSIPDSLIEHTHRLQKSLLQTEIEGVKVDLDYLSDLGVKIGSQLETLKPSMRRLVEPYIELVELNQWETALSKYKTEKGKANCLKPDFSFDSPKQLIDLLYNQLGLERQFNEKTKNVSVDESSLQKLKEQHELIPMLLQYRELQKIQGTYIEGTLERVDNGRIYPEFRVAGTVTGRISHSNPNLGQLPSHGGVRGIYVPDSGNVFISLDYSQLEVCLEANITGDANLRRIFVEGLSKHDITAQELGIDRAKAKTLNFALQYWASHFKVAKILGVSVEEGLRVWQNYWKLYSGPKQLKETTDKIVNSGAAVVTVFGRKRRFERRKRNPWDSDYRQAYNFLIQSTGADVTSKAFYEVDSLIRSKGYGKGVLSVHDELILSCKEPYAYDVEQYALEIMKRVGDDIGLKIPLKAESSGPMPRWQD